MRLMHLSATCNLAYMAIIFTTRFLTAAILIMGVCIMLCCNANTQTNPAIKTSPQAKVIPPTQHIYNNRHKVIHVFVALCDNLHQGIQPVPKGIGNGQEPATNLYWGCDYGVKAWFKNKTSWQLVATIKNPLPHVLERCIFKEPVTNTYMVADAYDGAYIKQTMTDFVNAAAGAINNTIIVNKDTVGINGNAAMIAYVGHEGLMDVALDSFPSLHDTRKRDVVILACESKQYWTAALKKNGANPLLWTTQLMCPEAYTLHAAITGWLNNESAADIHRRASEAYSKYQQCSVKAAGRLLATGY